jgi:hypothetical protein
MLVVDISRGGSMLARTPGVEADDLKVAFVSLDSKNVSMSPVWENDLVIALAFHQPISEALLRRNLNSAIAGDTASSPLSSA